MLAVSNITIFICIILFSQSVTELFTNRYSNWPSFYLRRAHSPKEQFERSEYVNDETKDNRKWHKVQVFSPGLIEYKESNSNRKIDEYKGANKWQQLATLDNWPYTYLNKSKITNFNDYNEPESAYKMDPNPFREKNLVENEFVLDSRKSKCREKSKGQQLDQLQCFPESGKAKAPTLLPEPNYDPDYESALNGETAEKITTEIFKIILNNKFLSDELGISMDDMAELQNVMFRGPLQTSQNCCKFIDSGLKCFLSWITDCDTRD
ncbi:uncharacterized protein LOC106663828 [Cimex lectularius]|uniref:Odorant binding protein n=1 Tax=Cimex lectularius TaxID=79782 RepID=A0A8I6RID4_CIMLE|nr:uncharacterized protein LOC106663828 [Cimex lectularius]